MIIGIGPQHHEIYGFEKVRKKRTPDTPIEIVADGDEDEEVVEKEEAAEAEGEGMSTIEWESLWGGSFVGTFEGGMNSYASECVGQDV